MAFFKSLGAMVVLLAAFGCSGEPEEDYHIHADFRVILEGKAVDFNKAEYMETPYRPLSEKGHLHDFNPHVIHIEERGGTLNDFFGAIGMGLDGKCFYDGAKKYCGGTEKTLSMYVNGSRSAQHGNYEPEDLDRILIYYGESQPGKEVFESLTSQACIYSKKCPAPEGFVFPEENCTTAKPCSFEGA